MRLINVLFCDIVDYLDINLTLNWIRKIKGV